MKILVFSLAPVFPEKVHGGSQKILRNVLIGLGKRGHKIKVLCTQRKDLPHKFKLTQNVSVFAILKYKSTYPEPHNTPPFNIAQIIESLGKEIEKHDVFYIHDAEMNWPFVSSKTPMIFSFRDFVYPDTLAAGFNFSRDDIITNSEYTKNCILSTMGRFRKGLDRRINVIPNGIDLKFFKPRGKTEEFMSKLGINKDENIILYPHRPDKKKGINLVLDILNHIINDLKIKNTKLLIPKWMDAKITELKNKPYEKVRKKAKNLNVWENIKIHEWVDFEDLPKYYSIGDVTLTVGRFVESFGNNASLESIACGTPVILTKTGACRTTLSSEYVTKVDVGDKKRIIDEIIEIFNSSFNTDQTRSYISKQFPLEKMINRFEATITSINKKEPLKFKPMKLKKQKFFKIPPWCYVSRSGDIYNDYKYQYLSKDKFTDFLSKVGRKKFTLSEARKKGISKKKIHREFKKGNLIVPYQNIIRR